ncbi:hypothetical protein GT044_27830 [Streptomyces sp. SID335]|nr:hypothetical protein [Streptomyces sp. SID335]
MAQDEAAVERVLQHIIKVTAKHLSYDTSEIAEDASFFDLGADSLQMIGVLRELEEEHRVKVSMRELFEEAGTARGLAVIIAGKATPAPATAAFPAPVAAPAPVAEAERRAAHDTPPAPVDATRQDAYATREDAYATRQEVEELRRQLQQLTQVQLQLMGQLSQLLTAQAGR